MYTLGKPLIGTIDSLLDDAEVQALQQVMNVSRVSIGVYSRIMFHNIIIHSCQWNNKGIMKQNNATVAYARSGKVEYGIIKKIAVINNDDPTQTIVIICKLDHRPLQQYSTTHRYKLVTALFIICTEQVQFTYRALLS